MILQDISETVSVEQASDQLNGNAAPSSRWGGTSTGPRDTGTPTHTEPGKKVGAQTFRICHPFLNCTHTTCITTRVHMNNFSDISGTFQ